MANPINVNPASAVRRLTIGGSDWLWVVTTIMCLSVLGAFMWSKVVGRLPWFQLVAFFIGTPLPKATSRNTDISLSCRGHPHSLIDSILCYGVRLGSDVRQNRVQARANA